MKVRFLLPLIISVLWLASCSDKTNKFTIAGHIEDMPETQVYLEELRINEILVIDSTKSGKKGRFELSGSITEPGLYRLRFPQNQFILLSLDKGTTKVTATWPKIEYYEIAGSPSSASLRSFVYSVREHIASFNSLSIVMDTMRARGNDSLLARASEDMENTKFKFTRYIEEYSDTTKYLANALCAVMMLNPAAEREYLNVFMQSLPKRFPKSRLAQEFIDRTNQMLGNTPPAQPAPAAGEQTKTTAPEIKLPTPDGKQVSLSSFRGKYVLVDFWASWCGPCRGENPNVVAAYKKFAGEKFTILGVSLDNNKDKWLQAIAKDQLTWTHISDLEGWESVAARDYKVESIPANFLIDPDGNIIAQNLRGRDLEAKLAEVLK